MCAFACKKIGFFFYAWLCSLPGTTASHTQLKLAGCPKSADYVELPCSMKGYVCEGWQAVWGEYGFIQDWVWTQGRYAQSFSGIIDVHR